MGSNSAMFIQFGTLIVFMIAFYAILLIPERKRKKKYQAMLDAVKVNDSVITRGGLVGKIIRVEDDYVIIESGSDKARLKFTKQSISTVTSKKEEA